MLHAFLELDERFDLRQAYGGQRLRELPVRYCWPSIGSWIDILTDTGHTGYLVGRVAPPMAPYFTGEYAGTRLAVAAPNV